MKQDAKTVASWDFDTIIPCHGASLSSIQLVPSLTTYVEQDVIEDKANEAWRAAYKAYLH